MKNTARSIIKCLHEYYRITGIHLTIGTVESASGGRIADKITNISGSSVFYKGSIVSYSNEIKMNPVGVKMESLIKHGAVSPQVAGEMAKGGRQVLNVDICVSDTGIAGPTGSTPGKPVGLFYFGLDSFDTHLTHKHIFPYNREQNKRHAVETALSIMEKYLKNRLANITTKKFPESDVVTSFLMNNNRILIVKRSQKVGTYRGAWSAISGYMEKAPLEQALTEIREETGFKKNDIQLIRQGDPFSIIDESIKKKWTIHPFLFSVKDPGKLVIDWENIESRWVLPVEIQNYNTVPGLTDALDKVLVTE
jgi:PncC family amidohydrolase